MNIHISSNLNTANSPKTAGRLHAQPAENVKAGKRLASQPSSTKRGCETSMDELSEVTGVDRKQPTNLASHGYCRLCTAQALSSRKSSLGD